jgi:hypothetical protein
MSRKNIKILVGLFAFALSSIAMASPIINFGGDMVGSSVNMTGAIGTSSFTAGGPTKYMLSYGTRTPASGYTGPAFSAGLTHYVVNATDYSGLLTGSGRQIVNSGSADFMQLGFNLSSTAPTTTRKTAALTLFSGSGNINSDNALSVSQAGVSGMFQLATWTSRWVVAVGGTLYASQETFTWSGTGGSVITSSGLTTTGWEAITPSANDLYIDFSSATFAAAPDLTNISAAGVLSEQSGNYGAAASMNYRINSFTAIPEPATIGMLGLGTLITLVVRRRQILR